MSRKARINIVLAVTLVCLAALLFVLTNLFVASRDPGVELTVTAVVAANQTVALYLTQTRSASTPTIPPTVDLSLCGFSWAQRYPPELIPNAQAALDAAMEDVDVGITQAEIYGEELLCPDGSLHNFQAMDTTFWLTITPNHPVDADELVGIIETIMDALNSVAEAGGERRIVFSFLFQGSEQQFLVRSLSLQFGHEQGLTGEALLETFIEPN